MDGHRQQQGKAQPQGRRAGLANRLPAKPERIGSRDRWQTGWSLCCAGFREAQLRSALALWAPKLHVPSGVRMTFSEFALDRLELID